MSKELQGSLVPTSCEWDEQPAGSFWFLNGPNDERDQALGFMCPCGCGTTCAVPIRPSAQVVAGERAWGWDGNRERPTLTPSIQRLDSCRWHGFLQDGIWKTC